MFGKLMAFIFGTIISPIISGFVIMKLWLWFIVPQFGLKQLNMFTAIGIMFLVGYLTAKPAKNTNDDDFWDVFILNILFLIFMSILILLEGWILHLFI